MYYKPEDIEKLLNELNIEDVVGEFVELKKAGANYKGLCPFHADTNPSFVVNPSKNICKCFVCETGGNAITFYSKIKKISFNDAVEELSKKYKITIKAQRSTSNSEKLEKYYEIMELSHKFFMEKIFSQDARTALGYLSNRGLDTKLIKEYQLGYSPDKWSELMDYLLSKGYKIEDLLTLGLVKKNEDTDNIYDTFRGRIIFPIFSSYGRVIAFGGRTMEKNERIPKYINSPDTPIFKKGKNIYGIERARSIKEKNYSILMEGYMDVISSWIYGFDTSIAPLGTALTEEQAKLIKRYTSNILLSFDMDKAGIAATERAAYMLKSEGFNIRVLQFQDAKDPDEYLKKYSREGFLKVVKNSVEIFDFLYNLYLEEYDLKDVISKQNFIEKFKEFFLSLSSDLEKEIYLKKLSEKVDIGLDTLKKTLVEENKKIFKPRGEKQENIETKEEKKNNAVYNMEIAIVNLLLKHPNYYVFFKNKKMEFELVNKIFKFFEKKIKENLILSSKDIIREFKIFIEESEIFTEYEKNNDLVEILMNYISDSPALDDKRENLEIFKSYFRYKMKNRNKNNENLLKRTKIGKFQKEIEAAKNIEEFIEVYIKNENLLD